MSEYDLRKAALTAAVASVDIEFRNPGDRWLPQVTERVKEVAEEYAEWLRDGLQVDEESLRRGFPDLDATPIVLAPQAGAQSLRLGVQTPTQVRDEVWGTERCGMCPHLTSLHSLDGTCFGDSACGCVAGPPVTLTAPDTDASTGEVTA